MLPRPAPPGRPPPPPGRPAKPPPPPGAPPGAPPPPPGRPAKPPRAPPAPPGAAAATGTGRTLAGTTDTAGRAARHHARVGARATGTGTAGTRTAGTLAGRGGRSALGARDDGHGRPDAACPATARTGCCPDAGRRSGRPPGRSPWRGMPCDGANGLLPGRAAGAGLTRAGTDGRAARGSGCGGGCLRGGRGRTRGSRRAGRLPGPEQRRGSRRGGRRRGRRGRGASTGAAGAGAAGAAAPGRAPGVPVPSGRCCCGRGRCRHRPGRSSRSLRTTGGSMVEDADRTNSPSSFSLVMMVLLSTPSSLASS